MWGVNGVKKGLTMVKKCEKVKEIKDVTTLPQPPKKQLFSAPSVMGSRSPFLNRAKALNARVLIL